MIEVGITNRLKSWAGKKTVTAIKTSGFDDEIGPDYKRKVYTGYIGEGAWWSKNPEAIHVDTRDYDFLLGDKPYDVKSWRATHIPKLTYTAALPIKAKGRGVGLYVFVAVLENIGRCFIVGEMPCDDFWKLATHYRKGDPKPGRPGVFRCDTAEVPIAALDLYH